MAEPQQSGTVASQIQRCLDQLTPTERKPARVLLANYPFAGLETVAQFASLAHVSGPTVLRLVNKLGFPSYSDFQRALRDELEARLRSPLAKTDEHPTRTQGKEDHVDRFASKICDNIRESVNNLSRAEFDAVVDLLADKGRSVYLVGGRLTDPIARYFYAHLKLLRGNVRHISDQTVTWSELALDIGRRDVVIIFDIRRYQYDLQRLADQAAANDATVVLFTDQWLSPIFKVARHIIPAQIDVPSNWDSSAALLALVEIIVTELNNRRWPEVKARIERLEDMKGVAWDTGEPLPPE